MGQIPATTVQVLDANNKFTPHWRRYFQLLDSLVNLFETEDTDTLVDQINTVKGEIAELKETAVLKATFDAEKGESRTRLDGVRDEISRLSDEVKTSTQVSTQARTELFGESERRSREINSLVSRVGDVSANVTTLTETVATNQSATATQFTQVETEIGENTASINEVSTSVDGIAAQKTISVNSNGDVDGYIQLSGVGGVSDFSVVADKFKVAHPNSGSPIPIFTATLDDDDNPILQVNGYIVGDNIVGGTITGININGSTITGALFQSPGGGITIDGRDEDDLSITLGA